MMTVMTDVEDIAFIPCVLRTIAWLLVLLGAPLRAWRRFRRCDREQRFLLEATLRGMERRGWRVRYEGEDDATVAKRLRMIERFIADPRGTMRHIARLARRYGRIQRSALSGAPPKGAPANDLFADASSARPAVPDSS